MNEKAKQFRQWCSERMGHPFPIQLARLAIDELEDKNQQLAQDKAELVGLAVMIVNLNKISDVPLSISSKAKRLLEKHK